MSDIIQKAAEKKTKIHRLSAKREVSAVFPFLVQSTKETKIEKHSMEILTSLEQFRFTNLINYETLSF